MAPTAVGWFSSVADYKKRASVVGSNQGLVECQDDQERFRMEWSHGKHLWKEEIKINLSACSRLSLFRPSGTLTSERDLRSLTMRPSTMLGGNRNQRIVLKLLHNIEDRSRELHEHALGWRYHRKEFLRLGELMGKAYHFVAHFILEVLGYGGLARMVGFMSDDTRFRDMIAP